MRGMDAGRLGMVAFGASRDAAKLYVMAMRAGDALPDRLVGLAHGRAEHLAEDLDELREVGRLEQHLVPRLDQVAEVGVHELALLHVLQVVPEAAKVRLEFFFRWEGQGNGRHWSSNIIHVLRRSGGFPSSRIPTATIITGIAIIIIIIIITPIMISIITTITIAIITIIIIIIRDTLINIIIWMRWGSPSCQVEFNRVRSTDFGGNGPSSADLKF